MNAYCTLNIMLGRFFIPKFADRHQDKQVHTSFYNTVLDVILYMRRFITFYVTLKIN